MVVAKEDFYQMALVKAFDSVNSSKWSERDRRATRHKIVVDDQHRPVNYENLQILCAIEGLGDKDDRILSSTAHEAFMKNYSSIFTKNQSNASGVSPEVTSMRLHKGLPSCPSSKELKIRSAKLKCTMEHASSDCDVTKSHDICSHLSRLHHRPYIKIDPEAVRTSNNMALRKLLKKLPYERMREDVESIYQIVKTFESLSSQMDPRLLKELCSVALLDVWDEEGIASFYVILAGRVKASTPHVKLIDTTVKVQCPTPDLDEDSPVLGIGECFGTLEPMDGRGENSRVFSVVTNDSLCEFLLITASDFARITRTMRSKEEGKRISLLQSCESYKLWSRQSLLVIADLIKWIKFPPNSVLVTEGSKIPFMGFIKSGECKVLRKVETWATLPNMKQERRTKDVFIGKLGPSDSFGEINVLSDIPMSCSIVTLTQVKLAVIYPQDIKGVDVVTKQLIKQSCRRVFDYISDDDVHEGYVNCELRHRWSALKKGILNETTAAAGIQAGQGKWKK